MIVYPSSRLLDFWMRVHRVEETCGSAWGVPLIREGSVLYNVGKRDFLGLFRLDNELRSSSFESLPHGAEIIVLYDVPDDKGILQRLQEFEPSAVVVRRYECPVAEIGQDFDAFLGAQLSRNRRKQLRGALRQLGGEDKVSLGWVTSEDVDEHFARFFRLLCERTQHARQYDRNVLRRDYLHSLWHEFIEHDLRVSVMSVNGTPVSYRSGFHMQDRFLGFMPVFDRRIDHVSVGHLHLSLMLREMHALGVTRYDFSKGDSGSKAVWANGGYSLSTVIVPLKATWRTLMRTAMFEKRESVKAALARSGWLSKVRSWRYSKEVLLGTSFGTMMRQVDCVRG